MAFICYNAKTDIPVCSAYVREALCLGELPLARRQYHIATSPILLSLLLKVGIHRE